MSGGRPEKQGRSRLLPGKMHRRRRSIRTQAHRTAYPLVFLVFSHGHLTAADRPRRIFQTFAWTVVGLSWPRKCQAGEIWTTHCTNERVDSKRPLAVFSVKEGDNKTNVGRFVFIRGLLEKNSSLLLKMHTRKVTLHPPPPSAPLWMHCALFGQRKVPYHFEYDLGQLRATKTVAK